MPILIPGDGGGPPATDFPVSSLIDEILLDLRGFSLDMPSQTWLTAEVSEVATHLPVEEPGRVFRGLAEIGDELVNVASSDDSGLNLFPNGRGYHGTDPEAHPVNTIVTFAPRFPRHTIFQTLNQILLGTFPQLWAMGTVEFPADGVRNTYALPAEAQDVQKVSWRPVSPTGEWEVVSRWRFNPNAATEYPTGKTIELPGIQAGRTIQVRYTKKPNPLVKTGDFTDSGYEPTAWPAIKYGTLADLVARLTMGKLEADTAQAGEYNRVGRRPVAVEISRDYYARFQQFLNEERRRLFEKYPTRAHYRR